MTVNIKKWAAGLLFCAFMPLASAQQVWVSDQFEVMLRSGPSTSNAIERMLRSGTARGGLTRIGLGDLPARGWGGKTGTYQVERRDPVGLTREEWRRRVWACLPIPP